MFLWILFIVTFLLFLVSLYVAYRFYKKAVILDEVFQYLADDININLKQFVKMATSPVLANDQEVMTAHNNMIIMARRLDEILRRMEEASGLKLRPAPRPNPPKVV